MRLILMAFALNSCSIFFVLSALCQGNNSKLIQVADSFFISGDYKNAVIIYRKAIDANNDALHLNRLGFSEYNEGNWLQAEKYYDKALHANPSGGMKASLYSRLARLKAVTNKDDEAIRDLDSAVASGYISIKELDTLKEFNIIRESVSFRKIRDSVFNTLYPCMNDSKAKEFDFWIGEWDVFITGTNTYAGHSLIEKISGGCAILENWNSAVSEGKSINFLDDSTHKWKQVWVGSYAGGKQDFINGEYKDSAMRFFFESRDVNGNLIHGRFIFFNEGPDRVRQFNESSPDGITWTTNYDFTYLRKKK